MMDPLKIKAFARQVHQAIPQELRDFGAGVDKTVRQGVRAQLAQFDLVDRQQFEEQRQQLHQAREQLSQLEQQVARLEAQLAGHAILPAEESGRV